MLYNDPASKRRREKQIRTAVALVLVSAMILLAGCGKKRKRISTPGRVSIGMTETGIASWYGHPYHGRRTANGEVYDMDLITAAHRTLPFGTWVRVHNLTNGRSVDVRINDRGPFIRGRIIDLSRSAARQIDMIGPGTAKVRITVIAEPPPVLVAVRDEQPPLTSTDRTDDDAQPQFGDDSVDLALMEGVFVVQVGAFENRENAERLRARMEDSYGASRLVARDGDPPLWRVLVGKGSTQEVAAGLAEQIRLDGHESYVVRLDEDAAPANPKPILRQQNRQ